MKFSLLFHNDNDFNQSKDGYSFILDMAKLADQDNFEAIWIPERHFDKFGASYPSPVLLLSAISSVTNNIKLNCGGLILPIHDSIKVAEEWSMLDILSKQRVGIAFTSGWHVNDFVLAPDNFANKNHILYEKINELNNLWDRKKCVYPNGNNNNVEIKIFPEPKQATLPQWLTSVMVDDHTWVDAGRMGKNVFTELLMQDSCTLKKNIDTYRRTLAENGYNPQDFKVTLMMHTFIVDQQEDIEKEIVGPFKKFLKNHLTFFFKYVQADKNNLHIDPDMLTEEDMNALINRGIKKYLGGHALIATIEKAKQIVDSFVDIGVDEIACLIDFGVDKEMIKKSFGNLQQLKSHYK